MTVPCRCLRCRWSFLGRGGPGTPAPRTPTADRSNLAEQTRQDKTREEIREEIREGGKDEAYTDRRSIQPSRTDKTRQEKGEEIRERKEKRGEGREGGREGGGGGVTGLRGGMWSD